MVNYNYPDDFQVMFDLETEIFISAELNSENELDFMMTMDKG